MGIRRLACVIQLVLITVLSLLPAWLFPPEISRVPGIDKWVHVAMYGLLGALLRWAVAEKKNEAWASLWFPVAAAGYGLLMEFCQLAFSGGSRTFSWGDAAANLAGVVAGWMFVLWLMGRHSPQNG